jgi:tetratricopeptide (TPR) repeat protein
MLHNPPVRHLRGLLSLALTALLLASWAGDALADYKTAISLFKRQKYREALKELQPDVSRNPDWEFGHRLAGLCYFYLKEYDNAIRAFERALELKSIEPSVYLGLAESYYQTGRMEPALAALEKGKAYFVKRTDQYNYDRIRAFVFYKQQRFNEAADSILSAFQHQAGSAQDWLILGISYFMTGKNTQAQQALTTALQMDRSLKSAQTYLDRLALQEAEDALKARNYTQARDAFQALQEKRPDDTSPWPRSD